jgi:hypothetical protein
MRNSNVILSLCCIYLTPLFFKDSYPIILTIGLIFSIVYSKIDSESGILFCSLIIFLPLSFYTNDLLFKGVNFSFFYIISSFILIQSLFLKFKSISNFEVFLSASLIIIGVLLVVKLPTLQSLSQFINFIIFILLVFYTRQYKSSKYYYLYLNSVIAFSVVIILQYAAYSLGTHLGKFSQMGDRISFGYIGWDYSHLSIYLAVGFYALATDKKFLCVIALLALLICNARSGVVALLLIFFYRIIKEQGANEKFLGILLLTALLTHLFIFRPEGISSDGRLESYSVGLSSFFDQNMLGFGFDGISYIDKYDTVVPHSTYLQIFTQFGLPFGVFLLLFFIIQFRKSFRKDILFILFAGFMFVPDIQASKFAPILIGLFAIRRND